MTGSELSPLHATLLRWGRWLPFPGFEVRVEQGEALLTRLFDDPLYPLVNAPPGGRIADARTIAFPFTGSADDLATFLDAPKDAPA